MFMPCARWISERDVPYELVLAPSVRRRPPGKRCAIRLGDVARDLLLGESFEDSRPARSRKRFAVRGLARQTAKHSTQRLGVALRDDDARVADDIWDLTGVRADHGDAAGHRLDEYAAKL